MNVADLRSQFATASTQEIADELIDAYEELRRRHYLRDFRPGQLEAGRFAEAAFRILQIVASAKLTPVGKALPRIQDLLKTLEAADAGKVHESIRIHIPRALATVYNFRNRRDVGHIAADVDANVMDADLVVATCNWVLAEFVRLLHQCTPEEATAYVERIVKRRPPLVQVFGEEPFVLAKDLSVKDEVLALLYQREQQGATLDDLDRWTPSRIARKVLSARLTELENHDRFIRRFDGRTVLTDEGVKHIESRLSPP